MKRNKKGFTLVELVIVIAVIAILAGVMIAVFSGVVRRANENAELQQIKNDELKQKAEDVLVKLDNANWFSWEDFENSLAEKMTQVYKDNANRTTGLTEEQLNAAIADSVKKALDEYVQKNATSETVITEAQIKAIIENAFAEAKLGGVTEEQVRTIVNTAVNGINTVSKADIQRIVDAATSKGLTAAQVAEVIGNSKLAKKDDTDALSAKVDDALAAINGLSSLTKQDVEDAIIELVPVTYTVHDEAKYYEMLSRLHSFSTIIIAEDFVYAAENTNKELKITNVVGDKTLTIKGIALEKLTVNAPKATIYLVSDAKTVQITSTNDHSFHVVGKVNDKLTINSGRVVLEKGAEVEYLKAAPSLNATVTVQLEEDSKIIDTLETEYQEWGFTAGNRDFIVIENNGNVNLTNLTASEALQKPTAVHTTTNVVIKNGRNATGTTAEVIDADEAMPDVDIIIDDTSYVTDTINEQKVLKSMTDEDAVRVGYVARIENSYYETLAKAVDAAVDGDTIVMLKDVSTDNGTYGTSNCINISKTITLDLAGYGVTNNKSVGFFMPAAATVGGVVFTIDDNSNNKTGYIISSKSHGIQVGSKNYIVVNNGRIEGIGSGIQASQYCSVTINDGVVKSNHTGSSYYAGIYSSHYDVSVTINGGTVIGKRAVWVGYNGDSLTVNGGTIDGTTYGVTASNGATVVVNDGTIKATGAVSANYGININGTTSSLTVNGGTITAKLKPVQASYATVNINGGTFTATGYNAGATESYALLLYGTTTTITGGTFVNDNAWTTTGKYQYGIFFANVQDANKVVTNGSLSVKDVDITATQTGIYFSTNAECIIKDCNITAMECVFLANSNAVCTVDGGNYNSNGSQVLYAQTGFFTVTGGTFTGSGSSNVEDNIYRYTLNCFDSSYRAEPATAGFTVTGGSFYQFNPENDLSEGENTCFTPEGYHAEYNSTTGYYTVVANN